jgi:transcriptional regulator with XRE-family HTH domain
MAEHEETLPSAILAVNKNERSRGTKRTMSNQVAITRLMDILAERRTKLGRSRADVAEAIGYTETALRRWETHQREPPFEVIDRLASELETDVLLLVSYHEEGLTADKRALLAVAAQAISALPLERAKTAVQFLDFQAKAESDDSPLNE